LLAKGTKRPKSKSGGAIDLTSEGDLVFIDSSRGPLGTLVEFTETTPHTGLRRDAGRLGAAMRMLEVVYELLGPGDPHPEVFELLHKALGRLDQADAEAPAVLAYFQWRLLRHVGLSCELRACVSCGRKITEPARRSRRVWFSSRLGGVLCDACQDGSSEKLKLDGATLAGLAALTAAEAGAKVAMPQSQAQAVNRLLTYHIQQQIGKPLRTAGHARRHT